jgi:single-strand DNA-binding protein
MDINHFVISGNVTRDPELRHLPSGTPTVTFTVACNFVRYDAHDAKHERTDFIPVTTFGKQAERDAKFLRKGSAVTVECRVESWYQPEEKRGGFNFKATNVQYGGRGSGNGQR